MSSYRKNRGLLPCGKSKTDWTLMLLSFLVFCVIGWIYEVLVFYFELGYGFVNRGFLFGPWLPVYGCGSKIFCRRKLCGTVMHFSVQGNSGQNETKGEKNGREFLKDCEKEIWAWGRKSGIIKSDEQTSFVLLIQERNNKTRSGKMNETLHVMETRRSCRNFIADKMVSEEDIQAIVKAGTYAATGMGKQSPIILAVTNKEIRDRLSAENAGIMGKKIDPFYGAPVVLVVLANKDISTYLYDGSLVMGNLMNAAASLGLGSIWIHRAKEEFESEFGKQILSDLGIEGNYEGIGHCAIGYAAEPAKEPAARKENYVYFVK